jgi:hypothetical protein
VVELIEEHAQLAPAHSLLYARLVAIAAREATRFV